MSATAEPVPGGSGKGTVRQAIPWAVPFVTFLLVFVVRPPVGLAEPADTIVRLAVVTLVVALVSRPVLPRRIRSPGASVGVGIAVFALWVAPDLLVPGYRDIALFQNEVVGRVASSMPEAHRTDPLLLSLRFLRAAVLVPVVEELFWRGWLPRYVINPAVDRVPLGTFTPMAFGATAVLFALEHGSFWDVGLVAGLVYNAWMWRTRSLGDLILCHAVTNACLVGYVLLTDRWQYL